MSSLKVDFTVRSYQHGDAPLLGQVFYRAVHEGAAAKYSERERKAWCQYPPASRAWEARLAEADTVVALSGGAPVGFMSLERDRAYLDLAYVTPEVMGKGIAPVLLAILEGRARVVGLTRLTTEASLVAEPFFVRQGWCVVRRQEVERWGVTLSNALMEKELTRASRAA